MVRDQDSKTGRTDSAGRLMFLSLFLLLLAFFILLNSMSTFEHHKSRAVIDSLTSTFRSVDKTKSSSEIFVSNLGSIPQPEDLIAEIERLWVTAMPVTKVTDVTPGRSLQIEFRANHLFIGGEPELRSDRAQLLKNVADMLAIRAPGFVNELEFVVGSDQESLSSLATGSNLEVDRVALLAELLLANGAPRDTIAIGIRKGNPRDFRMRFFVRRDDRAQIDFEELVE